MTWRKQEYPVCLIENHKESWSFTNNISWFCLLRSQVSHVDQMDTIALLKLHLHGSFVFFFFFQKKNFGLINVLEMFSFSESPFPQWLGHATSSANLSFQEEKKLKNYFANIMSLVEFLSIYYTRYLL